MILEGSLLVHEGLDLSSGVYGSINCFNCPCSISTLRISRETYLYHKSDVWFNTDVGVSPLTEPFAKSLF